MIPLDPGIVILEPGAVIPDPTYLDTNLRSVRVRFKGFSNALEILPSYFHVGCKMPKTSLRRKGKTTQAAGTRKIIGNAKRKLVETREEAAT